MGVVGVRFCNRQNTVEHARIARRIWKITTSKVSPCGPHKDLSQNLQADASPYEITNTRETNTIMGGNWY